MNLEIGDKTIGLNIENYIYKLKEYAGKYGLRRTDTPGKHKENLHKLSEEELQEPCDESGYRTIVGKLMFAANTDRPDIAFSASNLARYLKEPKAKHTKAAHMTVKYLLHTPRKGIIFKRPEENERSDVEVFVDADLATNTETRQSRTGYIIMFMGGPISLSSKLQKTIAGSTSEAKLFGLYDGSREALWSRNLMRELRMQHGKQAIQMWCDNTNVVKQFNDGTFKKGAKHVETKYAVIMQYVDRKLVAVNYINTKENLADFLIKGLERQQHVHL